MLVDGGSLRPLVLPRIVAAVAIAAAVVLPACGNEEDDVSQRLERNEEGLAANEQELDETLEELAKTQRKLKKALERISVLEDALAPSPGELPEPLTSLEHGGTYWGVFWVGKPEDAEIQSVAAELEERGYVSSSGDIACDEGASETLGVKDNAYRVAVYFLDELDAEAFEASIDIEPPPLGIAEVTTFCLD